MQELVSGLRAGQVSAAEGRDSQHRRDHAEPNQPGRRLQVRIRCRDGRDVQQR